MKLTVAAQFRSRGKETDPEKVEQYKHDAIRGLSNYFLYAQLDQSKKKS